MKDTLENRCISVDPEARIGHKTADSSFYGYKTHLAMTEERIITAATITTGERHDGKQLQTLIEKSEGAGMDVQEVIGDAAYSDTNNQKYTRERKIQLIARERLFKSYGRRTSQKEFEYNKDADMYVCPAGHMSVKKAGQYHPKNGKSPRFVFYFDVEKCKICPLRKGCYKEGAQFKTYNIRIQSDLRDEQKEFQDSDYFRKRARERYKIEAKNSELKNAHGYGKAKSSGLMGLHLQGAMTIFAVNVKRILKLLEIQ